MSVLENICANLRSEHGLSVKKFLDRFLNSSEESIIVRRKQWILPSGWKSTVSLLDSIKGFVDKDKTGNGQHDWEEWVLKQVSSAVIILWFVHM